MWRFFPAEVEVPILAAVEAFGAEAARPDPAGTVDAEGIGRAFLRLAFGAGNGAGGLPGVVAALAGEPGS